MTDLERVAKALSTERISAGLSQGELAALSKVGLSTIQRIEQGRGKLPTPRIIAKLAKVLPGLAYLANPLDRFTAEQFLEALKQKLSTGKVSADDVLRIAGKARPKAALPDGSDPLFTPTAKGARGTQSNQKRGQGTSLIDQPFSVSSVERTRQSPKVPRERARRS